MAEPGDEIAAASGGRGHLRASHADREQVIGALKAAFVQGMLAKDEFDLRMGQAFASRTYADLAAVTADLPAGLAAAQPPEPARESANKKKKAVAALACATPATVGVLFALPPIPDGSPFAVPVMLLMFVLFGAVLEQAGFCCSTHGLTSALAGSPRRGCHRAEAVRHPGAWHRPPRPGSSSRRSIPVSSKPPKLRRAVAPARHCPACGHRIDGTLSGAGTRSATPATDPAAAPPSRSFTESGILMWYGRDRGYPGDAGGEVRVGLPAFG